MAQVQLSDVVVPENYAAYMSEYTKTKTTLWTSGVIVNDESLHTFLMSGGSTTNLPFWRDLVDDGDNVGSDNPNEKSTPSKIGTGRMVAHRLFRTKSWSTMDLTGEFAGSDPAKEIRNKVAKWWDRAYQNILVAVMQGVFNLHANDDDWVNDIAIPAATAAGTTPTDANLISSYAIQDTLQTMGDEKDQLSLVLAHSQVINRLEKQDLVVEDKQQSEINPRLAGKRYAGRYLLIENDNMIATQANGRVRYVTAFLGAGTFKYSEKMAPNAVKTDRDEAAGNGAGQETL